MSGDKNKKGEAKEKKAGGAKQMILIGTIVLVLAAAAGGGVWFFTSRKAGGEHAKEAPKTVEVPKPAQYFAMDPPFVVNLNGPTDGPRYLQVEIQLMTRDPEELKSITENAPAIRAHLLMLLSTVQVADIADLAGRQKLQARALADAQKVMTAETGKKCVEDLLFTSFVTQ